MKFLSFLFLIFCSLFSYSQNVGIGTNTPHASAALEIKDSTKGILIPRMTMAQRNAIQNPAEGLMVYQTDSTYGFWYWGQGQWRNFRSGNNIDSLAIVTTNTANAITYTTANLNATINSNGGEMILLRGFFIDTVAIQNSNNIIVFGNGIGSFSINTTSLLPGKKYFVRAFATNANGTAVGDTVSFTTKSLTIPTLTTELVTNITNAGATCGGNITNDGGSDITARGVCYSTSPNPTINNSISVSGTGTGNFLTTLTGLNGSSTYYVRAFATNAIGTAYGEQRSFITVTLSVPTVTTAEATSISHTSVTTGLTVSNNGGSNIISQGVCYSTTQNPSINNIVVYSNNGIGYFSTNISGLIPNTTYYLRAFSTNSSGTSYGNLVSFTTLVQTLPIITTNNIISITSNSAISGGNISSDGGSNIISRGICWGVSQLPTKDSSHSNDGSGIGLFSSNITGLNPTTTYFVRAYAVNSLGVSYGDIISFSTTVLYPSNTGVPIVGTSVINYVTGNSYANAGGFVTNDGGSDIIARGICWSTTPMPTVNDSRTIDGIGLGYFSSTINNLSGCSANYYVRAYATNISGTGYGNQYQFNYSAMPENASVISIDSVNTTTAYLSGIQSNSINCPSFVSGICWSHEPNPTILNNHIYSISTNGIFNTELIELLPNYRYYCRSFVTNGIGTIYGNEISFTTSIPNARYIGEIYAGGIIFYIDNTGQHGLVCALNDQSTEGIWGCEGINISGTSKSFGMGAQNTANIIAGNCAGSQSGANICNQLILNGYSDWFLPSIGDLSLMYANLHINQLGNFNLDYFYAFRKYISSSQILDSDDRDSPLTHCWVYDFYQGVSYATQKSDLGYIRAIRSF